MRKFIPIFLILLSIPAGALKAKRHHHFWQHRPEFRAFPPSRISLINQNRWIARMNLERFEDADALAHAIERGDLVPILSNQYVAVAKTLPSDRRLVRPWVNDFLQDLGSAFYERFHKPIQVNSAVRTMEVQRRLRRHNRNAAPVDGETASSHEAGATIDLQRRGLSKTQIRFIEWKLLILYGRSQILEEEELSKQPCFHTMVSGDYGKPAVELLDIPHADWQIDPEIQ